MGKDGVLRYHLGIDFNKPINLDRYVTPAATESAAPPDAKPAEASSQGEAPRPRPVAVPSPAAAAAGRAGRPSHLPLSWNSRISASAR